VVKTDNRTLGNRTLRNRTLHNGILRNRTHRNKATTTMRDAAMLLLLRTPLRNSAKFCAFEKPQNRVRLKTCTDLDKFSIFFFRFEQFRHGTINKNSTSFVKIGVVKAEQGCKSFCPCCLRLLSDMCAIRHYSARLGICEFS
jgi:hypothetical protein